MISEKLLSAVMDKKCSKIKTVGDEIYYTWLDSPNYIDSSINIYKLQYLCKKWAFSWKYWLDLHFITSKKYYGKILVKISRVDISEGEVILKEYDSETEAIFEACEYILNKIER
jgi:hypothetical protein